LIFLTLIFEIWDCSEDLVAYLGMYTPYYSPFKFNNIIHLYSEDVRASPPTKKLQARVAIFWIYSKLLSKLGQDKLAKLISSLFSIRIRAKREERSEQHHLTIHIRPSFLFILRLGRYTNIEVLR
jgi:hypothetical protein